ncbi:MAG: hypothetical protein J7647_04230 [Cyanobacteria bacterium SBLK]|nr:hypothetical protein [Cyanobacteria bacterium SBLK]
MAILLAVLIMGWVAAAALGTQAYFRGEQSKPIHERNWNSPGFEVAAKTVTGCETDYSDRIPAYGLDAYSSKAIAS